MRGREVQSLQFRRNLLPVWLGSPAGRCISKKECSDLFSAQYWAAEKCRYHHRASNVEHWLSALEYRESQLISLEADDIIEIALTACKTKSVRYHFPLGTYGIEALVPAAGGSVLTCACRAVPVRR